MVISRKASELTGDRKLYHRSGKLYHRTWRAPLNYSFGKLFVSIDNNLFVQEAIIRLLPPHMWTILICRMLTVGTIALPVWDNGFALAQSRQILFVSENNLV